MKRGRPLAAGRVLRRVETYVPRSHTKIRELSVRFLELRRTLYRDAVETITQMAEILREGKRYLSPPDRAAWLKDDLRISGESARRYLRLHDLFKKHAWVLRRARELGPAKLYQITRLEPLRLRELFKQDRFRVVSGKDKTLEEMTDAELGGVLRKFAPPRKPPSVNLLAHGWSLKFKGLRERLERADYLGGIPDPGIREKVRREAENLVRAIRAITSRMA